MSTPWGPTHLLLFDEPLGDNLIDGRLDEAGRGALPTAIPLAVVDDGTGIVLNVSAKLNTAT